MSRQYAQQGSALIIPLFMSIQVIDRVLVAQFESGRGPLVIRVSVPRPIAGALIFTTLGRATLFTLFVVPAYVLLAREHRATPDVAVAAHPIGLETGG